jgi:hypothetical protein
MHQLSGTSITEDMPRHTAAFAPKPETIVWASWRMNQMRSYHGAPAVIELGEIGDDNE